MKVVITLLILFFVCIELSAQVNRTFFDGWAGIAEDVSLVHENELERQTKIRRASELIMATSLEYFPNPAEESLTVKPKFEGSYDLIIRTSQGMKIWGNQNLRGAAEIDLSKLTPGMYLLDYRSQTRRIVEIFFKR